MKATFLLGRLMRVGSLQNRACLMPRRTANVRRTPGRSSSRLQSGFNHSTRRRAQNRTPLARAPFGVRRALYDFIERSDPADEIISLRILSDPRARGAHVLPARRV